MTRNLIIGGGLAGLSVSYHLGHDSSLVLEKTAVPFGHAKSFVRDGFTWDEGPHVSFTSNEYVKQLFAESVRGEYDEYEVSVSNYFRGHWISHPAQSSLYEVPEPLRTECLHGFLARRSGLNSASDAHDYGTWLELAFGGPFARAFPAAYTRKYWTTDAHNLTTDWIGSRVYQIPDSEVLQGYSGPSGRRTHYITKVRYPKSGGYQSFAWGLAAGANIAYGAEVVEVDLAAKRVRCSSGAIYEYDRLVSTMPLPQFVRSCRQAPIDVLNAAEDLSCSQLLLVNVEVPHHARRPDNWLYVYDEDMYATRISFTEKLTAGNAPSGMCGIQVEVYGSKYRQLPPASSGIGASVIRELSMMKLIDSAVDVAAVPYSVERTEWANVIFDHATKPALARILTWLEHFGLEREADDLSPITDWQRITAQNFGDIILAGRFGQWKYAWSDDCVLRGRLVGGRMWE